jgi:hypothetical protein
VAAAAAAAAAAATTTSLSPPGREGRSARPDRCSHRGPSVGRPLRLRSGKVKGTKRAGKQERDGSRARRGMAGLLLLLPLAAFFFTVTRHS